MRLSSILRLPMPRERVHTALSLTMTPTGDLRKLGWSDGAAQLGGGLGVLSSSMLPGESGVLCLGESAPARERGTAHPSLPRRAVGSSRTAHSYVNAAPGRGWGGVEIPGETTSSVPFPASSRRLWERSLATNQIRRTSSSVRSLYPFSWKMATARAGSSKRRKRIAFLEDCSTKE